MLRAPADRRRRLEPASHFDARHTVSTILPMCSLDSISACAAAASASGNVRWISGRTAPAFEQRPHLARAAPPQSAPFSSTVRGRSVEPVMVRRRAEHAPEVDRRRRLAAHQPDLHQPPIDGQRRQVPWRVAAAHDVEDQIDAAVAGRSADDFARSRRVR